MDAYTGFAQVYDLFMDNVPYEEWADYIDTILKEYGISSGTLLDLGCGTGKITRLMADKGYDMIGVDIAMDMLDIAMGQLPVSEDEGPSIIYLLQDMCQLDLGEKVDAIYSACDCLNYLTEDEDLLSAFKCVYDHLEEGGIFIFDMNTQYKYEELLAENTFAENRPEGSFVWENYYDPGEQINQYDLTLFIAEGDEGLFRKFEETHFQRCYETDLVLKLLEKAGLKVRQVYEGYTKEELAEDSDRMTVICSR